MMLTRTPHWQFAGLLGLLVVMALLLSACGGQGSPAAPETGQPGEIQPASEIVLYNWTDYMNPEVLELFEAETGIRVIEDYFSSNEEMIAKLEGGVTGYTLVIPSDYAVGIMMREGMLAELDHANIPNIPNLTDRFEYNEIDPGNRYCIPYQWGTTGFAVRTDLVDPVPTSWAAIFENEPGMPTYGRVTMLDDTRESFAAALLYLGYDINTTDDTQLQEARAALIRAKAGLSGYDSDTFEDLLMSGENLIAHAWNGEIMKATEEVEAIEYIIPDEGGVIYMEEICIPITATPEQKLAGEMFINFILRGDVSAMLSEYIYYGSPNEAALEYLSDEYLENPLINPPMEVLERLYFMQPLGEYDLVYQRLWDEVKTAP
jgi:spermidine/putrescine transport system substrate-binding protein